MLKAAQSYREVAVKSGLFRELDDQTGPKEDISIKKYHQAALRRRRNNPNGVFALTQFTHTLFNSLSLLEEINPLSEPSSV